MRIVKEISVWSIILLMTITTGISWAREKEIPSNLAIRFNNVSHRKVHALFIYSPDFKKVFTIGGWSKKSFDLLTNIALKCAVLFPDEETVIGKPATDKAATEKEAVVKGLATDKGAQAKEVTGTGAQATEATTGTGKRTIKIPRKDVALAWVNIGEDVLSYIMSSVLQPDAILASMPKKDYFKHVFPGFTIDSYNPPIHHGEIASNLRPYKKKGDITLAIYQDDPKYGLPDFTSPLFIQDFNYGKYNSVIYGPEQGHAFYQYINPETKEKGPLKEKLFEPVTVSEGELYYQADSKDARNRVEKKEEELGAKIEFE